MIKSTNTIEPEEVHTVNRTAAGGEFIECVVCKVGRKAKAALFIDGKLIKQQAHCSVAAAIKWCGIQISLTTKKEYNDSLAHEAIYNKALAEKAANSKYSSELEGIDAALVANNYLPALMSKEAADKPLLDRKREIMALIAKKDNSAFNALAKMVA